MSSRSVVLVPADRATNVELVARVAMTVAPGAEIHVLHITRPGRAWGALEDWFGKLADVADTASPRTETARSTRQEGTLRHVHLRGTDERIIFAYAQLTGARAIVVDRRYGTSRLWRHSAVVSRMGRMSPVPVLALPSSRPALQRLGAGNVSRVLAAIDSTYASAVALRTSIGLVARHGARLTMLHALENVPGRLVFSGSEAWRVIEQLPAQQREVARRLEAQARQFGRADAVAHVITGDAAPGVVSAASETDADIIVMGVAPRTWLDRAVFGSTLGRVLRDAEIPVLIVPVIGGEEKWSEIVAANVIEDVDSQFATARIAA
jgi:nucleotide-binding universal stress UspA family protein